MRSAYRRSGYAGIRDRSEWRTPNSPADLVVVTSACDVCVDAGNDVKISANDLCMEEEGLSF